MRYFTLPEALEGPSYTHSPDNFCWWFVSFSSGVFYCLVLLFGPFKISSCYLTLIGLEVCRTGWPQTFSRSSSLCLMGTNVGVSWCMSRPTNPGVIPQLVFTLLCFLFKTESLTAWNLSAKLGWPVNPRDLHIFTSLCHGLFIFIFLFILHVSMFIFLFLNSGSWGSSPACKATALSIQPGPCPHYCLLIGLIFLFSFLSSLYILLVLHQI